MATKKVGTVIKEARTAAGLTQEQLARKVSGVSAADLGKVERGEADFTQAQLKAVAKALGVTQASLLNAPKNVAAKKTASSTAKKTSSASTAKKTSSASTAKKTSSSSTAKKPASSSSSTAAKKTSSSSAAQKTTAPKTPANANSTMKVTATERKLIEYYRTASANAKKAATKLLKGEADNYVDAINGKGGIGGAVSNVVSDLLGNLLGGGSREAGEE